MQYVEWLACVFFHDDVEPIHQGVVDAFVCAETRNVDAAMSESPLFGGGQIQSRRKDAGFMPSR